MKTKKFRLFAGLAAAVFIILNIIKNLYPDLLWFRAFGYEQVWWFQLKYEYITFGIGFVIAFIWLRVNATIANRVTKKISSDTTFEFNTPFKFINALLEQLRKSISHEKVQPSFTDKVFSWIMLGVTAGLSILFGLAAKSWWLNVFMYKNQVPYGVSDPLFNNDMSFYLFSLPFFENIHGWLFSLLFVSLLFVGWVYFSKNILLVIFAKEKKYGSIKTHIISLLSLFFVLLAFGTWLDIANLVYSASGIVYGAGYTDVAVILPVKKLLMGLFLAQAVLLLFLIKQISMKLPYLTLALIVLVNIVGLRLLPNIIQSVIVSPNEFVKEETYIKNNIQLTREAYQLNNIAESEFPATVSLTKQDLSNNQTTIENIRLWNQEPLKSTFRQLQEIRLYYEFLNVDVDRYIIDGKMRQVMLSPRELDSSQLTEQAQTWINQHLIYTHGYGLCMTPVNRITEDGLPHLFIKDLPPKSTIDLQVTRPEIYFGENAKEYIILNTKQKEFDYPKGDNNAYTTYQGNGGIKLSSIIEQLLFSMKFSDFKIFFSSLITKDSKLLFDHDINKIPGKIAPFIVFDNDPYLVVTDEGRLVWMRDGYTISAHFPYSEPINSRVSYIRNSVKVTIDAYNGTTHFYIADETDPIIKTIEKIYPNLFKPFAAMPADLKQHIRYPRQMFNAQAKKYATYHMTDTQVFYNKEDLWEIPNETYDSDIKEMKPYYLVTKLPGDSTESFVLMIPFSPTNKDNMIGWMAVKCDPDSYGEFVVFKLPKERTIYGPMQIESRIDQDTEISQKLTLWGQVGSRVIRGNLMIIPVEESLLYVEPIYLQAVQSELPELKRVILSYGDDVVMKENLPKAINSVFNTSYSSTKKDSVKDKVKNVIDNNQLLNSLFQAYEKLKEDAKSLNWSSFGDQLESIDQLIEGLKEKENKNK